MQATFLGSCLNRMSEAVVAAFPGGARSLPTFADVQKCIGWVHGRMGARARVHGWVHKWVHGRMGSWVGAWAHGCRGG